MKSELFIPLSLIELQKQLNIEIFAVGGYVRDQIMGVPRLESEVDICGTALPEQITLKLNKDRYAVASINKKLGTIVIKDNITNDKFEYTAFRNDVYSAGGKHTPESVEFTKDIMQDAIRRDFKMNAIYYNIEKKQIVDVLGGVEDIRRKIISTVQNADKVFCSDGLRIMRLVRFASTLNFQIEDKTYQSAQKYAQLLQDISIERIRDEFDKILIADLAYPQLTRGIDAHYKGFMLLDKIGALKQFLPIFETLHGVEQRPDYHKYDVFGHIAETFRVSHYSIRLAALMHDVAKLIMRQRTGRMGGHAEEGAKLVKELLGAKGMKYPNAVVREVSVLTHLHMFDLNCEEDERTIRRLIVENNSIIDKLLYLKQADYLGGGLFSGICKTVSRWEKLIETMRIDGTPFQLGDLMISATDIINKFEIEGEIVGKVMKELFLTVIDNPATNWDKNLLFGIAKDIVEKETFRK